MRSIAVVTGARSDYGVLVPLLKAIQAEPALKLHLWVTGMHFAREFGHTIDEIINDGFNIDETIEMLLASDTPQAIAKSVGVGVQGFAQAYARMRPDILVGLGDRFELFAAVQAALPFRIPVAHISGGEVTEGSLDDSYRHAITKLSHLHFVAAEPYGRRVAQMGEEPWRIHVTGDPGIDNIRQMARMTLAQLEAQLGMSLAEKPLLVTFHPATVEYEKTADHISELLAAVDKLNRPVVFTYPNADSGGRIIIEALENYVATHKNARVVRNLGRQAYCSLMAQSLAVVGNSSSGLVEAGSFELPVVNIGNRQRGRVAGSNVIHCDCERGAILQAINRAIDPTFRAGIQGIPNPYGDGHASARIVRILKETNLDDRLITKRFHDLT